MHRTWGPPAFIWCRPDPSNTGRRTPESSLNLVYEPHPDTFCRIWGNFEDCPLQGRELRHQVLQIRTMAKHRKTTSDFGDVERQSKLRPPEETVSNSARTLRLVPVDDAFVDCQRCVSEPSIELSVSGRFVSTKVIGAPAGLQRFQTGSQRRCDQSCHACLRWGQGEGGLADSSGLDTPLVARAMARNYYPAN